MAKRRASGEGNIRKRKDGRWEGRYTAGHDPQTGKAIIKNVLAKTQKECKKAGITENVRFHDLRHTFATLAIQNGVDAKTVSSILGHYSAGFTLDTYTHVTGEMQKDAAKRVGNMIAQAV